VLFVSLCLEGSATLSNIRELNVRKGKVPFFKYLRDSKDVDLIVVFGENSAAVLGLVFAMGALTLAWTTNNGIWDGIGSCLVGLVLVGVAIFLSVEVQSLLVGEAAEIAVTEAVERSIAAVPEMVELLNLRTVQQGAGEVLVAVKVAFRTGLTGEEVCERINQFEAILRGERPDIRWLFVEPDLPNEEKKAKR
jgi:divalent metal cation (Fe/Co/Zn/Cd) transporter